MIPKNEIWKIVCGVQAYRDEVRSYFLREIFDNVQNNPEGFSGNSSKTSFLDDEVDFRGVCYTVEALLSEIESGSPVGLLFAEAVYSQAQPTRVKARRPLGVFNYSDAIGKLITFNLT